MSTSKSYIDFISDQFSFLPDFRIKKMFGEYGIYNGARFFGVVCDEKLFLKNTKWLVEQIGDDGLRAYEGSKNTIHVLEEITEDREKLRDLVTKYLNN
jgi:TfoX/Sxy family transcriptional regulator of competence genes